MSNKTKNDAGAFFCAQFISRLLFILIPCSFHYSVYGQQYTAADLVTFKKSLAQSQSDAARINYQLKLADYFIGLPGKTKSNYNDAAIWINKAKKINEHLLSPEAEGHILTEESKLLQINGLVPDGLTLAQKAVALLNNSPDRCLLANAYKAQFAYYSEENPKQTAQKTYLIKQVMTLFGQCGNKLEVAVTLQDLAENYLGTGDFPLALKALSESREILAALHDGRLQRLYNLYGIYYFTQADYSDCLQYQYKTLEICKQMKDSTSVYCEANNMIAMTMMNLNENAQAIPYLKDALFISKINKDTTAVFSIAINLATCLLSEKKAEDALNVMDDLLRSYHNELKDNGNKMQFDRKYLSILRVLHQYDRAEKYALELFDLIDQPNVNKYNIANCYQALFQYYYTTGNYKKAAVCLGKNEKFIQESSTPSLKTANLRAWYLLDSAQGDYKGALIHLLAYKALEDSILSEKKSQQIQQLKMRYETQKKEDNIKILTQNAKIDQAQLKSERLVRNMTLVVICIFILITVLQYRRYHEKQKINLLMTEKNATLQKLVKEKEWLLKEIHHRVKNNLHTVICLLESQAMYLENDALKAIETSRHRIYAMSLIHQKLYQSDDVKVVNMNVYLTEFVAYLKESFGSPGHVQIILGAEPVKLSVTQAIPIGLIVNEAINNAFKYAFPRQRKGIIEVVLKQIQNEAFLLISDNGVGFKQADREMNSLGLELIKGLTLDLRGTIKLDTDNGTRIMVQFVIDDLEFSDDHLDNFTL